MRIIRQLQQTSSAGSTRSVLTIGSYDGIHRGHKNIIKNLKQAAANYNVASVLITFYPRPKTVLAPHLNEKYLTTLDEKLHIFEQLNLDTVAVLPFSKEFAQTPARQFITEVVNAFNPVELWVGPDFKLGKDRQGDIPFLQALGREFDYSVHVIDLKQADNEAISSTRIRSALSAGHIKEVTRLLGDTYFMLGEVIKGAQRGRTIGFPTANIAISAEKLLPPNGVYAVRIEIAGQSHPAVANIGVRPTFDETEQTVEVHIFDFNQDIYGQTAKVEFVEYLRPEQKFDGLESLIAQIQRDAESARQILSVPDQK